jgi:hypothetical protein
MREYSKEKEKKEKIKERDHNTSLQVLTFAIKCA